MRQPFLPRRARDPCPAVFGFSAAAGGFYYRLMPNLHGAQHRCLLTSSIRREMIRRGARHLRRLDIRAARVQRAIHRRGGRDGLFGTARHRAHCDIWEAGASGHTAAVGDRFLLLFVPATDLFGGYMFNIALSRRMMDVAPLVPA
jgi:hypothetical protein